MGAFDGKVAIVTGAGRGIGRVRSVAPRAGGRDTWSSTTSGSAVTGEGADQTPAQSVVDEIHVAGGMASANYDDCSSWEGAERLVQQALDAQGGLDVLVCNAGIVRDRMSFNMSEAEFDAVIRVHLKGHFAPIHFAAAHWRALAKETGAGAGGAIVTTSSESGLYGNAGQANYAAAKAGIAAMTIGLARELDRVGVRVNSVVPLAATRLLGTAAPADELPEDPRYSPWNAAAGAAWLASPLADGINGQLVKVGRRRRGGDRGVAAGDRSAVRRGLDRRVAGREPRRAVRRHRREHPAVHASRRPDATSRTGRRSAVAERRVEERRDRVERPGPVLSGALRVAAFRSREELAERLAGAAVALLDVGHRERGDRQVELAAEAHPMDHLQRHRDRGVVERGECVALEVDERVDEQRGVVGRRLRRHRAAPTGRRRVADRW